MQRRSSLTAERLEVILHDAANSMGQGEVPRQEKWLRFYLQALVTPEEQYESLLTEFSIPLEMMETTKTIIASREPDIKRYLVRQAASISATQIVDFDYSCRLVLTSSTYHGKNYPILHLKLHLNDGREISLELDQEHLDHVLDEFDQIEKAIVSIESHSKQ